MASESRSTFPAASQYQKRPIPDACAQQRLGGFTTQLTEGFGFRPEVLVRMRSGPEHGRRRGAKRNTARIVNSPSPVEMQTERRKAMEAAASLSGSDRGSQVQTAADCEPSDSDHESETSQVSDRSGPAITPGTSDCII
ncbi:hypothetical protein NDU88_006611 [Pleurodeles waltl]|uniref:Uncharacterized protein n=1 Tax=Pleurodeles waltl TaxID=8319 RepID=A0AAV7VQD6_PLEWA|nr:hypothetical protein NDU88_006611 [Pleurodeles waltl]